MEVRGKTSSLHRCVCVRMYICGMRIEYTVCTTSTITTWVSRDYECRIYTTKLRFSVSARCTWIRKDGDKRMGERRKRRRESNFNSILQMDDNDFLHIASIIRQHTICMQIILPLPFCVKLLRTVRSSQIRIFHWKQLRKLTVCVSLCLCVLYAMLRTSYVCLFLSAMEIPNQLESVAVCIIIVIEVNE